MQPVPIVCCIHSLCVAPLNPRQVYLLRRHLQFGHLLSFIIGHKPTLLPLLLLCCCTSLPIHCPPCHHRVTTHHRHWPFKFLPEIPSPTSSVAGLKFNRHLFLHFIRPGKSTRPFIGPIVVPERTLQCFYRLFFYEPLGVCRWSPSIHAVSLNIDFIWTGAAIIHTKHPISKWIVQYGYCRVVQRKYLSPSSRQNQPIQVPRNVIEQAIYFQMHILRGNNLSTTAIVIRGNIY